VRLDEARLGNYNTLQAPFNGYQQVSISSGKTANSFKIAGKELSIDILNDTRNNVINLDINWLYRHHLLI